MSRWYKNSPWKTVSRSPERPHPRELPSPIIEHELENVLTEARRARFRQVLARRTTRVAVVIEDCYRMHNVGAILRSCEAFGVHRVHVVTGGARFRLSRTSTCGRPPFPGSAQRRRDRSELRGAPKRWVLDPSCGPIVGRSARVGRPARILQRAAHGPGVRQRARRAQ